MDEHFQKEFFKKFPKDFNDSTKQIAIVLKTYLNFIFYSSMYKKRALKGLLHKKLFKQPLLKFVPKFKSTPYIFSTLSEWFQISNLNLSISTFTLLITSSIIATFSGIKRCKLSISLAKVL